ncbi:hypothetical protein [Streptomyces sp. NBC_01589]|uniref:hypothetical protein n=1 Tax=unclassified Streptomyces TaxID=2593676 RepID=UPI0038691FF7
MSKMPGPLAPKRLQPVPAQTASALVLELPLLVADELERPDAGREEAADILTGRRSPAVQVPPQIAVVDGVVAALDRQDMAPGLLARAQRGGGGAPQVGLLPGEVEGGVVADAPFDLQCSSRHPWAGQPYEGLTTSRRKA